MRDRIKRLAAAVLLLALGLAAAGLAVLLSLIIWPLTIAALTGLAVWFIYQALKYDQETKTENQDRER